MNNYHQILKLSLYKLSLFFLILGTLIGVAWMFKNSSFIPQYGDTGEYLELSKILKVDQYRGILYPTMLSYCSKISLFLGLPLQKIVYYIQLFSVFIAVYYFASFLLRNSTHSKIIAALTAIAVICNPLIAHLSLTLLSDSLATSLTLIFLIFLTQGCFTDTSFIKRFLYFSFATIFFILVAMTRVEKLYLTSTLFLGCCMGLVIIKYRFPVLYQTTASSLLALVFCVIAVGASIHIKQKTTIYNTGRPPLDFYSLSFNRVVWPRMSDVYVFFPNSLKQEITLEEANKFDSHANFVYPFLVKMLDKDNGIKKINSITILTLKNFTIPVFGKIFFDFFKYSVPNFTFPMEVAHIFPDSVATSWTKSRMEMFTPKLSRVLQSIGHMRFFVLLFFLLVNFLPLASKTTGSPSLASFNWRLLFREPFIFIILGTTVFLNSIMFTLSAGMDAHIRYALPTYTIIQTIVVTFSISKISTILLKKAKNNKPGMLVKSISV